MESTVKILMSVPILIEKTVQILVSIIRVAITAVVNTLAMFYDKTKNHAFSVVVTCPLELVDMDCLLKLLLQLKEQNVYGQ
jgi:hypothetical protein